MNWLSRHAEAVQAGAAVVTAVTAVLAVVGILVQMQAADRTSRAQTAREAYAAHLTLAVANPDFAEPVDPCALIASPKGGAYAAYVDHLLYAAELMLEAEPGWEPTFHASLAPHAAQVCAGIEAGDEDDAMTAMLAGFRSTACTAAPVCVADDGEGP